LDSWCVPRYAKAAADYPGNAHHSGGRFFVGEQVYFIKTIFAVVEKTDAEAYPPERRSVF
jgi:hypothetical protein